MKRLILAALAILLLSALLAYAVRQDPGYVLVAYGHYQLETSVWVGLLVFLLLLFGGYGCVALLRRSLHGGRRVGGWLGRRRRQRSLRLTNQGMIAYIEGNWSKARRLLVRAADNSEAPLLNYLMAARANDALGDQKQAMELLSRAARSSSGAAIAVALTQAELQLKSGQLEACLATLNRARRNAAKHPNVLKLLAEVYTGLGDWPALLELTPALRRHHVLPEADIATLERRAVVEQLQALALRADLKGLQQSWRDLPRALTRDEALVVTYAQHLFALGDYPGVEQLVRHHLPKHWQPALIDLYGRCPGDDVNKQLLWAEKWLQERNRDPALLRALGRISMRAHLWGKAREYLLSSLQLEEHAETCAELGQLMAQLGDHQKSSEYFQRGLLLNTGRALSLPALPRPA
ncbi:MAG: heme biosynthesis HemY N-terminal domain-containing protein [Spongiibacteraceae bacterium]|jgi:HemY protein|nr:heme biosynthesis HemY N-terminal domain-containing protein [Spongiibacteraceae bacterium]